MILEKSTFSYLDVKSIEPDNDFKLASLPDRSIYDILSAYGILFPLLVWEFERERYLLVDGYSRWSWAKETGYFNLPCFVFSSEFARQELLRIRVLLKMSESGLSLEERANIVERLLRLYPTPEVERNFLPLLHFPSKPGFSRVLVAFTKTSEDFRSAVNDGVMDEKVALRLSLWDEESRRQMLELIKELRCSVSVQREILDSVEDLGRMEGIAFGEVLKKWEVVSVLSDRSLSPRGKTERIRKFFKSALFPNLSARENLFTRTVRDLGLPYGVELKPPDRFEGDEWEIKIQFSKPLELFHKLQIIRSKISGEVLEKLFYGNRYESI